MNSEDLRTRVRATATVVLALATGFVYVIMGSNIIRAHGQSTTWLGASVLMTVGLVIIVGGIRYRRRPRTAYIAGLFLGLAGLFLAASEPAPVVDVPSRIA